MCFGEKQGRYFDELHTRGQIFDVYCAVKVGRIFKGA